MDRLKLIFLFVGAIGIVFLGAHASAQTDPAIEAWTQAKLSEVDTDQDGKVSMDEYLAHHQKRFNSMDSNSDGYLTKEEVQTGSMEKRAATQEKAREKIKKRRSITTE